MFQSLSTVSFTLKWPKSVNFTDLGANSYLVLTYNSPPALLIHTLIEQNQAVIDYNYQLTIPDPDILKGFLRFRIYTPSAQPYVYEQETISSLTFDSERLIINLH